MPWPTRNLGVVAKSDRCRGQMGAKKLRQAGSPWLEPAILAATNPTPPRMLLLSQGNIGDVPACATAWHHRCQLTTSPPNNMRPVSRPVGVPSVHSIFSPGRFHE